MKYSFIVNEKSRSGKGGKIWATVKEKLDQDGIPYDVFYTEYARHASEIARQITEDGEPHSLIVVGGDGTINEVMDGIAHCEQVELGYIPTGSGNDFSRELHLPSKPLEALANILEPGEIRPMDVGLVKSNGQQWRFAVSTGIGFDAAVCHQVAVTKLKPILNQIGMGSLVYTGVALNRLIRDTAVKADIELDDNVSMHFDRTYFVAAMNHPYEGGGFRFCPDAKIDDGLLDVIIVEGMSKAKILRLLPTAYGGNHVKYSGIHILQCRKAKITMSERLPVHADGEPVAVSEEIEASLLPEQVKILAPKQ